MASEDITYYYLFKNVDDIKVKDNNYNYEITDKAQVYSRVDKFINCKYFSMTDGGDINFMENIIITKFIENFIIHYFKIFNQE